MVKRQPYQEPEPARRAPAPPPAEPVQYPTWRYHRSEPPRLINGPDEEPGAGWSDTPPSP